MSPVSAVSLRRDGDPLRVEDGQRRVDHLVGRDDLGRHDPRVELARVSHEELERGRAFQEGLQVVARVAEEADVDDVLESCTNERERRRGVLFGHGDVAIDRLAKEFLGHDLEELDANPVVEHVVPDEPLELRSVGVDDGLGVLGVHCWSFP